MAIGLKRLCLDQFHFSLNELSSGGDVNSAVHEFRKSNKRVRALLRMVRPVIGDRIYRAENRVLAEASRLVAPARDASVMVDAMVRLRGRYGHLLAQGVWELTEHKLRQRHERAVTRLVDDSEVIAEASRAVYRARSRYAAWPVDSLEPRIGPRPLPDSFRSVGPGVGATYERGRKAMRFAYTNPRPENFHEWRKQVKYLRHQMEVVTPLWPEVIGGLAASLAQLGDVLGDDHDQAELIRIVATLPELAPDPDERHLLVALSNERRRELQSAARVMGGRIFAESEDQFTSRLKAYWSAWNHGG
jgi:CHAD domain-containing protein